MVSVGLTCPRPVDVDWCAVNILSPDESVYVLAPYWCRRAIIEHHTDAPIIVDFDDDADRRDFNVPPTHPIRSTRVVFYR